MPQMLYDDDGDGGGGDDDDDDDNASDEMWRVMYHGRFIQVFVQKLI